MQHRKVLLRANTEITIRNLSNLEGILAVKRQCPAKSLTLQKVTVGAPLLWAAWPAWDSRESSLL